MPSNFFLYYPPMLLGGAEVLFARIADELSRTGVNVTLADDSTGKYRKLVKSSTIEFYPLPDKRPKPVSLSNDTCILTSTLHYPHLYKFFDPKSNPKVIGWSIHPRHLFRSLPIIGARAFRNEYLTTFINKYIFRNEWRSARNLLLDAANKKSIAMMDIENRSANEKLFDLNLLGTRYLPIPTDPQLSIWPREYLYDRGLVLGWLGRLCDFKTHSLIRVLKDLDECVRSSRFKIDNFLIAGDGPEFKRIKKFTKTLGFNCSFEGSVAPENVKDIFRSVNIAFAMGTAALDLAAMSIPVCLVDASYGPIPDGYRYRWLFETKDYNLGAVLNNNKRYPLENTHRLEDILFDLVEAPEDKGQMCQIYVKSKHNLRSIALSIIDMASVSEQRLSDVAVRSAQKRGQIAILIKNIRRHLQKSPPPWWFQD